MRLALLSVLVMVVVGSGAAGAATITGVSDEHLDGWDATANSVFDAIGVHQVRDIVPWDVATNTSSTAYTNLASWVASATLRGDDILISFNYDTAVQSLPDPAGDYRHAVDLFRADFPNITEYTAWNEPNFSRVSNNPFGTAARSGYGGETGAQTAADYWNQLAAACEIPSSTGKLCTVAAGDFADGPSMAAYASQYQTELSTRTRTPTVWAVHAYSAVENESFTALNNWIDNYTGLSSNQVWITEVGAYFCNDNNIPTGDPAHQQQRAQYLHDNAFSSKVNRVYYYFLAQANGGQAPCGSTDEGLIGAGDAIRPALTALFPQIQPPTITTGTATSVTDSDATLNGTVTANGLPTTYHFDYGTTTAYGSRAPATDGSAGSGTTAQAASTGITGLQGATTYHYRLVATNGLNTTNGADQTFTTPPVLTTPVAFREASTGYQWVYSVGRDRAIQESTWNGSAWSTVSPGGFVADRTNVAAVRDATTGHQWVFYVGGGDASIWEAEWNGASWVQRDVGGAAAPNSSPVVLRDDSSGVMWVYYVGSDNTIREWTWDGSSWSSANLGGFVAGNTSLAATRDATTGHQWVYYVGGGDTSIWQDEWSGTGWTNTVAGGAVAPNTNPAVVRDPSSGVRWVYYTGSDSSVRELTWDGSTWYDGSDGGFVAPSTSPAVVRDPGSAVQWVYYTGGGDSAIWELTWTGSSWVSSRPGGSATDSSPAVVQPWGGFQWIYYQGTSGPIQELFWDGGSWAATGL